MRARLALLAIALTLPLLSGSCSTGTASPIIEGTALPALPHDGPAWTRQVSEVSTIDGVDTYLDCGAPGAQPHASEPAWLTLDGDLATGDYAWAIWQIPLSDLTTVQEIEVSVVNSGLSKYYLAWADYSAGQWRFINGPDGKPLLAGPRTLTVPGAQIDDETAMHSPGEFAYLAMIVLPGNEINVSSYVGTVDVDNSANDPIFDDFEDNDTLATCTELTLVDGHVEVHASVHQTDRDDMDDPNEDTDTYDVYCLDIPAGQEMVATLRYEPYNHFGSFDEQNLDLLLYHPGADDILNDMDQDVFEQLYGAYYIPFEQIEFGPLSTNEYKLCVLAEVGDGVDDDAEYYLNVFVNSSTYLVTGTVTVEGQRAPKEFVVYLEPGNYNDDTLFNSGDEANGNFSISGVPNGTYTLHVMDTSRMGDRGHIYAESAEVTVFNSDPPGTDIDIPDHNF